MYNPVMAKHVIHIEDAEAASDFASLLDRVRKGAEIVIEHDARPVAWSSPRPPSRCAAPSRKCIALLPEDSTIHIC